jgi:hypothetical protein
MSEGGKSLRCVPGTVTLYCETSASAVVRVRSSDGAAGVDVTPIGFDTSRVSVTPESAATNARGFAEFTVRCTGGGFCPAATTVVFSPDDGAYEECDAYVECERLGDPERIGSGVSPPTFLDVELDPTDLTAGDVHAVFLEEILRLREQSEGDYGVLVPRAVEELHATGAIGADEADALSGLGEATAAETGEETLAECREVRRRLVRSGAGPTALAISSIACDSAASSLVLAVPVGEDVLGAVVGAGIGSLFGNPFVGAVVGGLLLSSAEFNPVNPPE